MAEQKIKIIAENRKARHDFTITKPLRQALR